jgi:hypothetical protein
MAKHEFGIMQDPPLLGKRYDDYEPEKYHCISVDDDFLEGVIDAFNPIDFYWHTLDVQGKGLAYCGITLIPPQSLAAFLDAIRDCPGLSELTALAKHAQKECKWIIHYGL